MLISLSSKYSSSIKSCTQERHLHLIPLFPRNLRTNQKTLVPRKPKFRVPIRSHLSLGYLSLSLSKCSPSVSRPAEPPSGPTVAGQASVPEPCRASPLQKPAQPPSQPGPPGLTPKRANNNPTGPKHSRVKTATPENTPPSSRPTFLQYSDSS